MSEQTMFDYIDGKLNADDCHEVEKHLIDCELCSDALEGLRLVKDRSRVSAVKFKLKELTEGEIKKERRVIWMERRSQFAVAATLALLICSLFLLNTYLNKGKDVLADKSVVAHEEPIPLKEQAQEAKDQSNLKEVYKETREVSKPVPDKVGKVMSNAGLGASVKAHMEAPPEALTGTSTGITTAATTETSNATGAANLGETITQIESTPANTVNLKIPAQNTVADELMTARKSEKATDSDKLAKVKAKSDMDVKEKIQEENKKKAEEADNGAANSKVSYGSMYNGDVAANSASPVKNSSIDTTKQLPQFPGGKRDLKKFIRKNLNVDSCRQCVGLIVNCFFTVNAAGVIEKPVISKSDCPCINAEVLRVIQLMPAWRPGKQNGVAVSLPYNLSLVIEGK